MSGSSAWPEITVPLVQSTCVVPSAARVMPVKAFSSLSTPVK